MTSGRIFLCFFAVALVIQSFWIPPLQSPDETDHIKRAWLLRQGQVLLTRPIAGAPASSGGEIDTGLLEYMGIYSRIHHKSRVRLTASELDAASELVWSHDTAFSPAPGTGYYFPLIYLPQALALTAGEILGFSIHWSYWLARVANVITAVLILDLAFAVWSPNALVMAILMLPMMMFQFNSTSIDGTMTALVLLVVSTFVAVWRSSGPDNVSQRVVMATVIPLLVCAHQNLIPLVLLPASLAILKRSRAWALITAIAVLSALIWAVVAVQNTVDLRVPHAMPGPGKIQLYAAQPGMVVAMIANTIFDAGRMSAYWKSWMGILGWWDTYLSPLFYAVCPWFLASIGALSFNRARMRERRVEVTLFLVVATGMVLLTFLAMIFGWTPIGATKAEGLQGRYFIIPSLLVAATLQGWPLTRDWRSRCVAVLLFTWGTVSFLSSSLAIIRRYHG